MAPQFNVVLGVVLFLVAASLALILIPVIAIVGTIAVWRLRSRMKAAGFGQPGPFPPQGQKGGPAEIIDAEYRIIEQGEPPRR